MPPRVAIEDAFERLARLEEQLKNIAAAIDRLGKQDVDLDLGVRGFADRLQTALANQAESLRTDIDRLSEKFASRDDVAMIKAILVAAVSTLIAFTLHKIAGTA